LKLDFIGFRRMVHCLTLVAEHASLKHAGA
jgi:hypothetical protein